MRIPIGNVYWYKGKWIIYSYKKILYKSWINFGHGNPRNLWIIIVFVWDILWINVFIFPPKFLVQVALLLLLSLSNEVRVNGDGGGGRQCEHNPAPKPRPHTVSILEFGAVGDGKTLNTIAFQNAIFYLKSFADKGGAQLYVPPGTWLTKSFNLTSHLTLFLEKGAVILGSQVFHLLLFLWLTFEHCPFYWGYKFIFYFFTFFFLQCYSCFGRIRFSGKLLIHYLLMVEELKFRGEDIRV